MDIYIYIWKKVCVKGGWVGRHGNKKEKVLCCIVRCRFFQIQC